MVVVSEFFTTITCLHGDFVRFAAFANSSPLQDSSDNRLDNMLGSCFLIIG